MAVSKRLRYEVLRRDNHACRYCGAKAPDVELRVDHVTPRALGGSDEPSNLVTACFDCNSGKTSVPPDAQIVADVAQDALRWARAMEMAGELQAKQLRVRDEYHDTFLDGWRADSWGPLGGSWVDSVETFRKYGLPIESVLEAIRITMSKRHIAADGLWKYFCGVCWRMIEEQRSIAEQILALEEQEGAS